MDEIKFLKKNYELQKKELKELKKDIADVQKKLEEYKESLFPFTPEELWITLQGVSLLKVKASLLYRDLHKFLTEKGWMKCNERTKEQEKCTNCCNDSDN